MQPSSMLADGEELELGNAGQRWLASWHQGPQPPTGRHHGSAGICVTDTTDVVLISADGVAWDFPAGRPEGDESWEQTLRREMLEEACAAVDQARLLGFSRGRCIEGSEFGLVLVRAIWLAKIQLLEWNPKFEIRFRRVVPAGQAIAQAPLVFQPIWRRAFAEAGLW